MADRGVGESVDRTHISRQNTQDKLSALGVAADSKGKGVMTIFFMIN